jgi:hypothetical protein
LFPWNSSNRQELHVSSVSASDKVNIWLYCGQIPSVLRTPGIRDIVSLQAGACNTILLQSFRGKEQQMRNVVRTSTEHQGRNK